MAKSTETPRRRGILAGMDARTALRLTAHDERRAAVAAGVDPRSIRAYLDPARRSRMRSTTAGRIEETLVAMGLASANPEPPQAA